jgi:hypothetical protein
LGNRETRLDNLRVWYTLDLIDQTSPFNLLEGSMGNHDFGRDINSGIIKVTLVDGTQISACVNLDRQPGYNRVSDLISSDREPFLILMNSTMYKKGFESPLKYETLFINKDHIMWATPEDRPE